VRRRLVLLLAAGACVALVAIAVRPCGAPPRPGPVVAAADAGPADAPRGALPPVLAPAGASGVRVAGHVFRGDAPLAGATVRAVLADHAELAAPITVASDAAGAFDLGRLPAAAYVVSAEHDGLRAAAVEIDLRDPTLDPPPDRLALRLAACDTVLHGTVRDVAGGVVAGARVRARSWRFHAETVTGADGGYELCVPPDPLDLAVRAEGYAPEWASAQAKKRLRRDFEVSPEATLTGRVIAAEDGAPIAGALVQVGGGEALSGEDGSFRLAGLFPGKQALLARAPGRRLPDPIEVQLGVADAAEVVVPLERAARLRGAVVDLAGAPVPGAVVGGFAEGRGAGPIEDAVTDAGGRFVLDGLAPGTLELAVRGHVVREPEVVTIGEKDQEVTVRVARGATLAGVVVREGRPVADARVYARPPNDGWAPDTRSGPDGRFRLAGLAPGTYLVGAESIEAGAFTRDAPLTLAEGDVRADLTLDLELAGAVAGVVVDEAGAPVAGARVELSLVGGRDYGWDVTGADGSFEANALSGGGEYQIEVHPAQTPDLTYRPAGGRAPRVAVRDGRSRVTGVRVVVAREDLAIRGRVLAADGTPVPDVPVTASPAHDEREPGFAVAWAMTTADGSFAITGLVGGRYELAAYVAGGRRATLAGVPAGKSDVVLRLPPTGRLEVTLDGFAAPPRLLVFARGGEDGAEFRALVPRAAASPTVVEDVPAGVYVVVAEGEGEAASEHVQVDAGRTARVALVSSGSARLALRLVDDATGAPVAAAACTLFGRITSTAWSGADGTIDRAVPAGEPLYVRCTRKNAVIESLHVEPEKGAVIARRLGAVVFPEGAPRGSIGALLDGEGGVTIIGFVFPGGPADAAGLRHDDVIVSVDGADVTGQPHYRVEALVAARAPGTTVRLGVRRGGEALEVNVAVVTPM
jgi:protocatechuate 3,4-dioxygenase beta subunit